MVKYIKSNKESTMEPSAQKALQSAKNFEKIRACGQFDWFMDCMYMYYIRKDEIPEILKRYNKWVEKVTHTDDIDTKISMSVLSRPLETFTENEVYKYM